MQLSESYEQFPFLIICCILRSIIEVRKLCDENMGSEKLVIYQHKRTKKSVQTTSLSELFACALGENANKSFSILRKNKKDEFFKTISFIIMPSILIFQINKMRECVCDIKGIMSTTKLELEIICLKFLPFIQLL